MPTQPFLRLEIRVASLSLLRLMKQNPPTTAGFSFSRVLLAFLFCVTGVGLAMLSFAANPPGGTITPSTGSPVTWQGTASGVPPTGGGEETCEEGVNCDTFKLTISGTPADWTARQVRVRIQWLAPASDYDLAVHKGSINGPLVASSGSAATTSEEVVLNPSSSSIGTGDFYVRAIYYAVAPGDQYNGTAAVDVGAPPPLPAPTPSAGVAARYQNYTPPAAGPATLGIHAGEPSIGVNWNSEGILPGLGDDVNGGRAMYIALLQTLRITFDDSCPASPSALWEDKSFATTSAQSFDPILYTDQTTGRTLVSQLEFPAGALASASAYTDNDGDLWVQSTGAGPGSGIDHQTIGGGGPFAAPLPVGVAYNRAIYYCGQLPNATCALSLDGGTTYGPAVPVDPGSQCGGLHGHIKVGPDGTAYLPNKDCLTNQGLIVSENNGATWTVRTVPGSTAASSDAAVAIGRGDVIQGTGNTPVGRVYLGYADGNNRAVVTSSADRGATWSTPLDVGAVFGVNNVVFPAMVAGDDNRAAFSFLGTPTAGGLQGPRFAGIWHLYVAHTYDGGATWRTVDATPNDPLQRGCIWLGGGANICRNMLDFMGMDVDKRGRVLVGYNDGCAGAECSQAPATATGNSYTDFTAIARQTGGKGLFAAHDSLFPDAPTVPGAPFVTALRNSGAVKLAWSTSNTGGSPVTQYTISRGTSSGSETFLANVPGSQLRYIDGSATDPNATYFYKVSATNSVGPSCGNNEVQARYRGDSSSPGGFVIYTDPNETGPQTANPDLDIESLAISEPATGPNAGKIVFNLRVADLTTIPNNRMWRIVWDSPNAIDYTQATGEPKDVGKFYVGMTKDASGVVTYEYGTVDTGVVGLVLGVPETRPVGPPDAGSFVPDGSGLITIVVSKDKIGNVRPGDLMGNFAVRTYAMVINQIRTTNAIDQASNGDANDFTANAATYQVVGPVPGVGSAVSRKTHGAAGTFDIDLPLVGSTGIECRNDGSNNHQIVFRLLAPATFTGAIATPGNGGTASVASTSTSGNDVIVNLTNVSDRQTLMVTLQNVTINGGTANVSVPVGILAGDAIGNGSVNSSDVGQAKSLSGQNTNGANFRNDVTVNGTINSSDVGLIKSKSGNTLPAALQGKR